MINDIFTVGLAKESDTDARPYKPNRDWITHAAIDGLTGDYEEGEIATHYRTSEYSVCPRMSVLKTRHAMGGAQSASSRMYTKVGDLVHTLVQDAWHKKELLLHREYSSEVQFGNHKLTGHCDAILRDLVTNDITLVDIKTTGPIPKKAKAEYESQIGLYGLMLGITSLNIMYVSRNIGMPEPKMKNYVVNPKVIAEAAKSLSIGLVLKDDELPDRLKSISKCKYCSFEHRCWGNESYDSLLEPKTMTKDVLSRAEDIEMSLLNTLAIRRAETLGILSQPTIYDSETETYIPSPLYTWTSTYYNELLSNKSFILDFNNILGGGIGLV